MHPLPPQLTSATQADVLSGPTSTAAQTRFVGRIPPWQQPHPHESRHPYSKGIPASPSHKDHPRNISPPPDDRPASSKAKTVLFTAPTYYAHSASGLTSEGEEAEEEDEEEGLEGGRYVEDGEEDEGHRLHEGDEDEREYGHAEEGGDEGGGFDEDDEDEGMQAGGEESEFSDDADGDEGYARAPAHAASSSARPPALALPGEPYAEEEEEEEDNDDDAGPESRRGHSPYALDDGAVPPETGSAPVTHAASSRAHWDSERDKALEAQRQAAAAEVGWARRELGAGAGASPRALERGPLSVQDLAPAVSHVPADLGLGLSLAPASSGSSGGLSPTQSHAQAPRRFSPSLDSSSRSQQQQPFLDDRSGADEADDLFLDPAAPTKKLSATPRIARNSTTSATSSDFDELLGLGSGSGSGPRRASYASGGAAPAPALAPAAAGPAAAASGPPQRVRGVDLVDPRDPRYNRMLQPTKQAGEDVVYERMVAATQQQRVVAAAQQLSHGHGHGQGQGQGRPNSGAFASASGDEGDGASLDASTGSTAGEGDKRASSSSDKKRKSGGGILGLFRKKDKKKKGGDEGAAAAGLRSSEDSGVQQHASPTRGSFRRSTSSSPSLVASGGEPRSSAERSSNGHGGAPGGAPRAATAESMFSTDAALRQQELEARQALFHQYGVQRAPGDVSNTMTPRGAPGVLVMSNNGGDELQGANANGGGSKRNSLQLLSHPASVVGPNGALASPTTSSLAPPQRIRPGSLIGSPNLAGGLEVPVLSVMRVFAGAHIDSEATFKTVLLNTTTTAADLVKQAMQRFRLTGSDLTREEFYLTVKELGGDERALQDDDHPLRIFEDLSDREAGDDGSGFQLPPSVKRSSIGSINSISSNLSMHPAITRSGVNDWSDDSAVKFYLHRRGGPSSPLVGSAPGDQGGDAPFSPQQSVSSSLADSASGDRSSAQLGSSTGGIGPAGGPSYRFAVRLLIHPADLPDNVVFDPLSNAIIPRSVLVERQARNGGFVDPSPSATSPNLPPREKIIFFPRNANVSEVIETALDRFGIVDGVVDGGDEVEDRVNRRRSQTRVKYGLAVQRDGRGASSPFCIFARRHVALADRHAPRPTESFLNASSKLLKAYSSAPLFKAYDRSSKEFRRRSADATLILGSASDVQPQDPVFVIRRSPIRQGASARAGVLPQTIDELEELHQRRAAAAAAQRAGDNEDEEQEVLQSSPNPEAARGTSQRDLIAAQRAAAQRANQSALLSARGNDGQGFDITIPEQGTIRSSRADDGDEVRYSFVHQDGTETDISEIVENEWHGDSHSRSATPTGAGPSLSSQGATPQRPVDAMSRAASTATTATDAESFVTAAGSLPLATDDEDEEERRTVDALRSTSVDVERSASPRDYPLPLGLSSNHSGAHADHLRSALGPRPMTSPVMSESLQERLDRVLARVKEDKLRRAASPTGSFGWRPRSYISNGGVPTSGTVSGRTSPAASVSARSASALSGRRSPFGDILRDSPSIDQLMSSSSQHSPRSAAAAAAHAPPRSGSASAGHAKKASIASMSSSATSTAPTDQLSTPVTTNGSSSQHHFTPASSANSNHRVGGGAGGLGSLAAQGAAVTYRDDFGYETLAAIVGAAAATPRSRRAGESARTRRDSVDERMFGRELDVAALHPEVGQAYEVPAKAFSDLDAVRRYLRVIRAARLSRADSLSLSLARSRSASTHSCAS